MNEPIGSVVVVGGGTAGWLTAARIAARHGPDSERPVTVTLIESPNIRTIGVGEGTWPTLRETLEAIGVAEADFVRDCNAAFKQGGKFVSWVHDDPGEFYYHPFNLPQGHGAIGLAPYWDARRREQPTAFADAVDYQARLCEAGLAPKKLTTPEYRAVSNYAYHLNADRFGVFLKEHCVSKLGVAHVVDDVTEVNCADDGYIDSLSTAHSGPLTGDLFVDCTGFRALLLGQKLGVGLRSHQDVLFVDNALVVQVPYDAADAPVACQTIGTAQKAGWVFDIGLQSRRGVGYIYSSAHSDHDGAEAELHRYVETIAPGRSADLSYRRIPIQNGYRETFWKNNCVAIGLSAGFLEPLEASAIMLIETAAKLLAERLPANRAVMAPLARAFNDTFHQRWARIIDFLKLHYALTRREDSAFWRDNRRPESIPDSLQQMLQVWRYLPPSELDFLTTSDVFPAASYQYVLLGMQYDVDYRGGVGGRQALATARRYFARNEQALARATAELPSHRALLTAVCEHGLQPV